MTRASRKNRARKAQGIDPHALASIPKRQPNGQKRRADDARAVAKAARVTHCAVAPDDALDPILATDMGRCIAKLATGDDRRALEDAWHAISAAHRNYRQRYLGTTGDPQAAALPMLAEPTETDPSLRVDLRTPGERDDAAKRAWVEWQARINALPLGLRWAIRGALEGFIGEGRLWDRGPTATGSAAVQALRIMCQTR